MILISLVYILDFALNDQYTYEAMTFYNHTDDEKEIEKRKNDPELNPLLNLTITTFDFNENLYIYDMRDDYKFQPKIIPRDQKDEQGHYIYHLKGRVNDIRALIVYYCGKDENCSSLREEFSRGLIGTTIADISIEISKYEIDHFNDTPVVQKGIYNLKDILFYDNFATFLENREFEIIKYKDQKSLFDFLTKRKTEYYMR